MKRFETKKIAFFQIIYFSIEQKLSKSLKAPVLNVSAKTGQNIMQAFGILIKEIIKAKELSQQPENNQREQENNLVQ